jgi:hypothetical protein
MVTPSIHVPGPNVVVHHASASAFAGVAVQSSARAGAFTSGSFYYGNRLAGMYDNVETMSSGEGLVSVSAAPSYAEERVTEAQLALQAICMDDRATPHAASQTFADKTVDPTFSGEVYRCVAGTAMRVTIADASGRKDTLDCTKGQALVYDKGQIVCRTQIAARPCNERSLLRRYGPGEKTVMVQRTETVRTSVRREQAVLQGGAAQLALDGGVGGGPW